jgi:hypothetical protein
MTPVPFFGPSPDSLAPRSPADRAREEQAFYDLHANSEPWKTALKRLAPIPVVLGILAAVVGLSHALR